MTRQSFLAQAATVRLIAARGIHAALFSAGGYGATGAGTLLGALAITGFMGTLQEKEILAMPGPIGPPLYLAMVINAVYLAFSASIAISRERDNGTLAVLFYGPVDPLLYVGAKYLEHIGIYGLMAAVGAIVFTGFEAAIGAGFSYGSAAALLISLVPISGVIAFGILLSALTRKIRTSVLWLVTVFLLFLGVEWADAALRRIEPANFPAFAAPVQSLLGITASCIGWVSPFTYLSRVWTALEARSMIDLGSGLAGSLAYSLILLGLAVLGLKSKGVKAR
jgi:hypothetical protein